MQERVCDRGLGRFEDDLDTISNAADRQMAHVRTFQTGARSALSQRLLNEISAARVCLLDRARKAEYDARLRAKEAPLSAAPAAAASHDSWLTEGMALSTAMAPLSPVAPKRKPQKKKSPVVALAAASVLLVGVGAVALLSRQRSEHCSRPWASGCVSACLICLPTTTSCAWCWSASRAATHSFWG